MVGTGGEELHDPWRGSIRSGFLNDGQGQERKMKIRAKARPLAICIWWCAALAALGCGFDGDDRSNSARRSSPGASGTITVAVRFLADSDVNDPAAAYIPNDSFAQAQSLPNPVVLGGYVNLPQTGGEGRSFVNGDPVDYFSVDLTAGQAISLYVRDAPGADLDLALYDANQTLVDASVGPASVATVTAPAAGSYFVEVRAVSLASIYNVTVGQPAPSDAHHALRLSEDFIPGEVIVRFHEAPQRASGSAAIPRSIGMTTKAGASGREMLLAVDGGIAEQETARMLGIPETRLSLRAADPAVQRKLQTLQLISALRQRPDVRSADPNYIRRSSAAANDPQFALQWHYFLINLPQAWDVTTGSANVIVAVADSGVLLNHPDLQGRLTAGFDFIRDPQLSGDGDGIDPDPDDPGDQLPGGSRFHGTHVTGTVAAATNNAQGVAGVTQATQIMPLRVLGIGGLGTEFDVLQAVRYAAGLENDSGTLPAQRADVINLSLGGGGFSQAAQEVFTAARAQGVIVVASAGNESGTEPSYPAAYDGVVSVSAVDIDGNLAWYSNSGPTIDLAAPGGDTGADLNGDGLPDGVLSTCGDGAPGAVQFTYCFLQGTSMASPHAAGVAALMKAVHPALTPAEFDQLLINGLLTNSAGRDDLFGYGQIDAFFAVAAARDLAGGAPLPPTIIARPAYLNLESSGAAAQSADLEILNGTPAPLTIGSVIGDPAATWLRVAEKSVDANKLGIYSVTADPGALPPGVYAATISATATDPGVKPATVPVRLQIFSPVSGGNVGPIYVLLVTPDTLQTVAQVIVPDTGDGQYGYTFTDLSAGTYRIYAGTDIDNDGFIGDAGEALGAYLTVDQPASVAIPGDNAALDFGVGFDVALPSELGQGVAASRTSTLQRSAALKRIRR
jgi:serine protease